MDIDLFVSALIQIFILAQEELSKTDLLFQSYDNIFTKITSLEIKELFGKYIIRRLGNVKKGNDKSWRHDTFLRTMLSNQKPRRTKIQTQLI